MPALVVKRAIEKEITGEIEEWVNTAEGAAAAGDATDAAVAAAVDALSTFSFTLYRRRNRQRRRSGRGRRSRRHTIGDGGLDEGSNIRQRDRFRFCCLPTDTRLFRLPEAIDVERVTMIRMRVDGVGF